MIAESPASIHEFWFGLATDDRAIAATQSKLWWSKDTELDQQMRIRFEPLLHSSSRGELAHWSDTPIGWLATVLLHDQFPRNIYRGRPDSFAFDSKARDIARTGIDKNFDRELRPIERIFCYLPFEHSELLADQDYSVGRIQGLHDELAVPLRIEFDGYLDFALRHREVIARFGRFPHRNLILGRDSSADEQEFLTQPGSSF